jgi:hypothetical protein
MVTDPLCIQPERSSEHKVARGLEPEGRMAVHDRCEARNERELVEHPESGGIANGGPRGERWTGRHCMPRANPSPSSALEASWSKSPAATGSGRKLPSSS